MSLSSHFQIYFFFSQLRVFGFLFVLFILKIYHYTVKEGQIALKEPKSALIDKHKTTAS